MLRLSTTCRAVRRFASCASPAIATRRDLLVCCAIKPHSLLWVVRRGVAHVGEGQIHSEGVPSTSHQDVTGSLNTFTPEKNVVDEEDDDLAGVTIFRPDSGLSAEEKERKQRTDAFLRIILTTKDEQEWKDMLSAALRLGTWREHHLQAVLRGVKLLKYDEPVLGDAIQRKGALASTTARSNATLRLARARDVLLFLSDESQAVLAEDENASGYKVSEGSVHSMLTMLLRGAQHFHNPHRDLGATAADALPCALYRDVWSFLAWMELHGYHVNSMELLTELEATIDLDEDTQQASLRSESHASLASDPSGSHKADGRAQRAPQQQHALVSRRINRLEYIRGEKEHLIRSGKEKSVDGAQSGEHRRSSPALRTSGSRTVTVRTELNV